MKFEEYIKNKPKNEDYIKLREKEEKLLKNKDFENFKNDFDNFQLDIEGEITITFKELIYYLDKHKLEIIRKEV